MNWFRPRRDDTIRFGSSRVERSKLICCNGDDVVSPTTFYRPWKVLDSRTLKILLWMQMMNCPLTSLVVCQDEYGCCEERLNSVLAEIMTLGWPGCIQWLWLHRYPSLESCYGDKNYFADWNPQQPRLWLRKHVECLNGWTAMVADDAAVAIDRRPQPRRMTSLNLLERRTRAGCY